MYGLVQAPRKFYEKFRRVLTSKEVGMVASQVDPCMYFKFDSQGQLIAILIHHVDDAIITGNKEAVRAIKEAISTQMGVKDEGLLSKHLGVTYEFHDDGSLTMHQDDYIQDIIENYEKMFGPSKSFSTPGYPGTTLSKADKTSHSPVLLSEYRSFVGKVLFAMKKTYPEIANAVRELAGHMDFPTDEHWKSVGRLVGYLKHKAIHGLRFKPPTNYNIVGFVDTDYATNKDNRKSTTGYLLTFGGCLVSWLSKAQPSVTLSSTEAEYVGASTLATEIKFVIMMLEEMKIQFSLPAIMYEDNTGAIFLMNNNQVGQRTKHIDVRHHHVRNMIIEKLLKVHYIKSENNPSDIMTKNTVEALQGRHERNIKQGELYVYEADPTSLKKEELLFCKELKEIHGPVHHRTKGAKYCSICDDYFITDRHEMNYKHLEFHVWNMLHEMAKYNKAKQFINDVMNREDVVNNSFTIIHDSDGTEEKIPVNTDVTSFTGTKETSVPQSLNVDDEVTVIGQDKETSDTIISSLEMVSYSEEIQSEGSINEVKSEMGEAVYLSNKLSKITLERDAGSVIQYDHSE
jgi:hypothetical protein